MLSSLTYNTRWKASLMCGCIRASGSFGKNLCNNGITTCWYQSSTLVTSNFGISGTTDVFCGRYMSASSARVQLSRNWVRVVLLISDMFLWRNTAGQDHVTWQVDCVHTGGYVCMSIYVVCEHVCVCVWGRELVPRVWKTQSRERSSQWVWKPTWTHLQPVRVEKRGGSLTLDTRLRHFK